MTTPFTIGHVSYAQKSDRPFLHDYAEPKNTHKPLDRTSVKIFDARAIRSQLALDVQGFTLLDHKSEVTQKRTQDELGDTYVNEMAEVVSHVAGDADLVLPCGGLMMRYSDRTPPHLRGSLGRIAGIKPSNDVHMDFTEQGFHANAERALELAGCARGPYRRIAVFQTWRALSVPPHDFPFAFTDTRSVNPGQHVVMKIIMDQFGNSYETRMGLRDDGHIWHYFSNLRQDELVVFKGFDTDCPETLNVYHAAFDDTATHPDANPRSSVEMRMLAYWK